MTSKVRLELGDGVKLAFNECGNGPAILFHQGFSLTRRIWDPVVEHLKVDYRCITFDPRGHGESDAPFEGYSLERLATDVTDLATCLDLRDVTLVGHSFGGAIALTAAARHDAEERFSRLVLLGPSVPTFVQRDGLPYGVPHKTFADLHRRINEDFAASARDTAEIFFHQTDPEEAQRIFESTLAMRGDVAGQLFAAIGELDLVEKVDEIAVPVLALWGAHDGLSDPRWADWFSDRQLPNWELGILASSGHGCMVDEPDVLAALIRKFIYRTAKDT